MRSTFGERQQRPNRPYSPLPDMRFRQSVVLFGMTLNSFSIGEQENKALEGSASVLADIPSCAVGLHPIHSSPI